MSNEESRKDVRNVCVVFGNYIINTPIVLFAVFIAYAILVAIVNFDNPIQVIFNTVSSGWFIIYSVIEVVAWLLYTFTYFMSCYEEESTDEDVKKVIIVDIANNKNEKMDKMKVSWKKVIWAFVIIVLLFGGYKATKYTFTEGITVYNTQKDIRNTYEQKIQERNIVMSEFIDCLKSSLNVSEENAKYFKDNVQTIMENRSDGDKLMWKWVKEVNPNANFNEVSTLFQHMQTLYKEKRSTIIEVNKVLFELEKRDANLRMMFPSNIIIRFVGETEPLVRK